MTKKLLLFLLTLTFLACNNSEDKNSKITWIGGEIVNPKMDYILFRKNNTVVDTIPLDDNNFFIYKTDCVFEPGIFSFQHYENQIFFLEPGDSLMLRLNTVDFDESLAYTGKGAERNNLLMDFYLLNENEMRQMPLFYELSPEAFAKKIDSFTKHRTDLYNDFIVKNPSEKDFKAVAKANIAYDEYIKKEIYSTIHSGVYKDTEDKAYPKDFFSYRDDIEFGNDNLISLYSYHRFFDRYLDNIAYKKYVNTANFNKNSYVHTFNKIKLIDSLITSDSLKVNLMRRNVISYLLNGKDPEKGPEITALFTKLNKNTTFNKEIENLSKATVLLASGNKIPNVFLLSTENMMKDLHSILKKPTVLYFWSSQSIKHFRNIHAKAAELQSKYPEYDFIGINTDTHFKKWRSIVLKSNFNPVQEYQFDNIDDAEKKLVINSTNKAIIVDKNGVILEGNTNIFRQNFEEKLLGYLNK